MELQQIKTGRPDTITAITDETINRIAKVHMFNNPQLDEKLYELHQKLLFDSKNKNNGYEVGYFWDLCDIDTVYKINGSRNGIILANTPDVYRFIRNAPVSSVVIMHNHPRNGLFSAADLTSFSDFNSIYAMTAICNDGTIYMMKKTPNFNPIILFQCYNDGLGKGVYSGMKNVARNIGKIGIEYRCSVKRRSV